MEDLCVGTARKKHSILMVYLYRKLKGPNAQSETPHSTQVYFASTQLTCDQPATGSFGISRLAAAKDMLLLHCNYCRS